MNKIMLYKLGRLWALFTVLYKAGDIEKWFTFLQPVCQQVCNTSIWCLIGLIDKGVLQIKCVYVARWKSNMSVLLSHLLQFVSYANGDGGFYSSARRKLTTSIHKRLICSFFLLEDFHSCGIVVIVYFEHCH